MTNWETDRRDIGECLSSWERQYGWSEEDAALELRLTKQTYRRIKIEQHLVGEGWLRRMMCLIDKVGPEDVSEDVERWLNAHACS